MIPTLEERREAEIADLRKARDDYANEKAELRRRLIQLSAVIDTPLTDEQDDVGAFGRDAWVYCRQHMRPHETGWCSVGVYDKIGLGVKTADEALAKCREWGLTLYRDLYPNG